MSVAMKNRLSGPALEIVLTAANSAAQAWYGYDQGVISGILIDDDFVSTFPRTKDSNIQGITASCFSLGNLVGCLLAAIYGDRLGRKNTLRVGAAVSSIGAILQFTSFSLPQFIIGRVINGFGNGMTSSTCGIFQAESCRGPRRGKLSVIVVLHNVVFYCLASWLSLGCSYIPNGAQWRLPLALQLVPATVLVCLLSFLPESPRWLVMHDRSGEAHDAVRRYLGTDLSLNDPDVLYQLASIEEAYRIEQESHISFKEIITRKDRSGHLKRMILGMGTQFIQQWGGINALNYYFPIILTENLGFSELMARVLTGCNATSYMISTGLAFWMIERLGRRTLMLSGLWLQGFAYVMVAIAISQLNSAPSQWGAVGITFLFFYYAAFGCTWGMVPWIYQAEVNSLAMRTKGAAAATATNWLFGFVCTQFTPTAIRNITYRFYIIFAALNLLFVPVVYFFYPETANRTLEDLDDYFDDASGNSTIIAIGNKTAKSTSRPQSAIDAEVRRVNARDERKARDVKDQVAETEHLEESV